MLYGRPNRKKNISGSNIAHGPPKNSKRGGRSDREFIKISPDN
jgi:hypothetical protein